MILQMGAGEMGVFGLTAVVLVRIAFEFQRAAWKPAYGV